MNIAHLFLRFSLCIACNRITQKGTNDSRKRWMRLERDEWIEPTDSDRDRFTPDRLPTQTHMDTKSLRILDCKGTHHQELHKYTHIQYIFREVRIEKQNKNKHQELLNSNTTYGISIAHTKTTDRLMVCTYMWLREK